MVLLTESRTLFLGHFGSGKTEVAIHFALSLTTGPKRPLLLDLDFITPYYRSREVREELARQGVDLIAPEGDLSRSDLPVVTSQALHSLASYAGPVVVDVGGDEGARVIGSMAHLLPASGYQAVMVVNTYRPGTGTPAQIAQYARWLEQIARIRFSALVNNANVGPFTTPAHLVTGRKLVESAAELLGLPVAFSAATEDVARQIDGHKVLPLQLRMRPPWEGSAHPSPQGGR